jgi:hypothetical protein
MIPLTGNTEEIVKAGTILRDFIFQRLPLVLNFPHLPQLTEEEKNKVIDKLTWLANRERVGDVNLMAKFEEKNIPKTEESMQTAEFTMQTPEAAREEVALSDDRSAEEKKQSEEDTDLYNIKNFSL